LTSNSARELESLKKTLKEMGHEISSLSDKMKYEKETNIKLQRENEKHIRETHNKEKKIMQQKIEISDFKVALENERAKNAELEKKLAKLNKEMGDKNKKIAKTQKDVLTAKKNLDAERLHTSSPHKQSLEYKSSINEIDGEDNQLSTQLIQKMEIENKHLTEKLTKITHDVELLSKTMTSLLMEKARLEKEVMQRETMIDDLRAKYSENNELLQVVQTLEDENCSLSSKLDKMVKDVELLAKKMYEMQTEKAKLEEEVTQRETLVEELLQKYKDNNGLLDMIHKLEDENEALTQRLDRMVRDVGVLTQKFMDMQEQKRRLEEDALQKENIIDDLTQKYKDIEKVKLMKSNFYKL